MIVTLDPAEAMRAATIGRFWAKAVRDPDTGCVEWLGALDRDGYGRFQVLGRCKEAHRFIYETEVGPIPDGLVVDHLCRNHACQNTAHMEPVTSQLNTLRGYSPAGRNAWKTHCHAGHPLSGENLYINPAGERQCRECARERGRRYWARKRAAA